MTAIASFLLTYQDTYMTISKDIKDRLIDAMITALVFAAALAWKDTLVAVLSEILPEEKTIWSDIIVSVLITSIVIAIVYFIIKGDGIAENKLFTFNDRDQDDESSQ